MLFRNRPCRSDAESFHSEVGNGYILERRKAVRGLKSYGTLDIENRKLTLQNDPVLPVNTLSPFLNTQV